MTSRTLSTRGAPAALWDWNLVSGRVHFSPRWIALVGGEEHEVGTTPDEWLQRVHPQDLATLTRELDAVRAGTSSELGLRHRLRHKDGTYRWMSCQARVTRDKSGRPIRLIGSHADVTVDAATDPATGLPNRLLLLDRISRSIEQARQHHGFHFALIVLELGRPSSAKPPKAPGAPDLLLVSAARRLETTVGARESMAVHYDKGMVARLDGDHFAILIEGLNEASQATVVGDWLLAQMLAPFTLKGSETFLSTSMGTAVSATGYRQADDVLRDAETALRRAAILGGSHAEVFDTAILASASAEQQLEDDLFSALDRGQFRLVYQPIVSLGSNQIVGFEALVRWDHAELGVISPAEFMATAERTGFILPLGRWIIQTACRQLKAWHEDDELGALNLTIAVNLASAQLHDPDLVDQIDQILRDTGADPRCLVLELTEGTAMENPTAVKSLLMRLRSMGVRISIDDFGTGYSSLSYLRQFPVDALKIDRSFIRGIESHADMAEIMATMTTMSQQLGLKVVAEGIENEEQVDLLRRLHCDAAQGYLFAEPLDADRATEMLKGGASDAAHLPGMDTGGSNGDSHRSRTQWLSLAAMAIGAVSVAVLGIVNWRTGQDALSTRVDSATEERPHDVISGTAAPAQPHARAAVTKAPSRSQIKQPPARLNTSAGGGSATSPATSTSPNRTTPPLPATTQPTEIPTSVRALALPGRSWMVSVAHLHRVGSCKGRLVVTPNSVAFVPDDPKEKDSFLFQYADFLQALDGDTVTIKTSQRTYRFKATSADAGPGPETTLQAAVERMVAYRQ